MNKQNKVWSLEIDLGEIFFAAVVIWMMWKVELMAVVALCSFAAVCELSRIRKMMKKNQQSDQLKYEATRRVNTLMTRDYGQ